MPWKDGAAVADSWTMGQPATLQTYQYTLTAGTGVTAGMSGAEAIFITAEWAPQQRFLERRIALAQWRGKRLRVALRFKNQDKARGYAVFSLVNSDGSRLVPWSGTARTGIHQDVWDTQQFVVDVPANADEMIVHAGLFGPGTVWIDRLAVEAAGAGVPADRVRAVPPPLEGTDAAPPAIVPPGAGAVRLAGDWHTKHGFRGAAISLLMGSNARIRLADGKGEGGAASLSGDATVAVENTGTEPQIAFARFGGLESDIDLDAWRGKRVRLTLRLKNVDGGRAYAIAQVNQSDGDGARTLAQRNAPGSHDWETHQFVLDVPEDGNHLYVYAGMTGKGAILADGLTLEAVSGDAALSRVDAVRAGGPIPCSSNCSTYYSSGDVANGGYTPPSATLYVTPPGPPPS